VSRTPGRRPALPPDLDPRHALARAGRRVRTPMGRVSLSLAALLSVAVLAISSVGWAAVSYFDNQIGRVNVKITSKRPAERPDDENVLLVGDDSREGTNGQFGSQAEVGGLHSDTTMIAHLGADGSVTLLSVPRDTLVTVPPGVPNTPADGKDKFTNVLANGGISATIQVVESMTGLKINHFIIIDLEGFRQMTNAVGGVTVCVAPLPNGATTNLNDAFSQWHGHLGLNKLDGDQALAFVRTRHALGDERLRIARQQVFLADLLKKATGAGVLTNPIKITNLIGAIGGSLKVDSGLSRAALIKLAGRLRSIAGGARFATLPTHVPLPSEGAIDDLGNIPPHGDVLFYDQDKAQALLDPLRPASENRTAAPTATLTPSAVTITEIRNDTGRAGLAGQTRLALTDRGFVADAAQAITGAAGQTDTEVHYGAGQQAAADTLAAAIPGATTVPDTTVSSGLVLVLGSSFTGVSGTATATASTATGGMSALSNMARNAAATPAPAPSPTPTGAPAAPNCTP
jgi:LCP family protein required for cell wall assembly